MFNEIRDHVPSERVHPALGNSAEAAAQASVAQFVGLGSFLPFDRGMALMGGQDSTAELSKVRAHLGLGAGRLPPFFRELCGIALSVSESSGSGGLRVPLRSIHESPVPESVCSNISNTTTTSPAASPSSGMTLGGRAGSRGV